MQVDNLLVCCISSVVKFRARSAPFKAYMFEEGYLVEVSSVEWWMAMEGRVNEYFIQLVKRLLCLLCISTIIIMSITSVLVFNYCAFYLKLISGESSLAWVSSWRFTLSWRSARRNVSAALAAWRQWSRDWRGHRWQASDLRLRWHDGGNLGNAHVGQASRNQPMTEDLEHELEELCIWMSTWRKRGPTTQQKAGITNWTDRTTPSQHAPARRHHKGRASRDGS